MKTKFICAILTTFILISCSTDTSNPENSENCFSDANPALTQKEDALDAPFRACYYKHLHTDTYAVFFEIPANYHYTVSESEGFYFIELTAANTNNNAYYVTHMEKFNAINGLIDVTFRVNGLDYKKPKVVINTY